MMGLKWPDVCWCVGEHEESGFEGRRSTRMVGLPSLTWQYATNCRAETDVSRYPRGGVSSLGGPVLPFRKPAPLESP